MCLEEDRFLKFLVYEIDRLDVLEEFRWFRLIWGAVKEEG